MTRAHQAATFQEALAWLDLFTGWHRYTVWMPLERRSKGLPYTDHHMTCSRSRAGSSAALLARWVQHADLTCNEQVTLGLPRQTLGGAVTVASVLWVVTEGKEQTDQLRRFRPLPSLIVREGQSSRRTSLWPLDAAFKWVTVERANRRLAYRMRAVQKHADPDVLEIPAPACLRAGRAWRAPVVVERLSEQTFMPMDLVGKLRDPPEQDWTKIRDNARRS